MSELSAPRLFDHFRRFALLVCCAASCLTWMSGCSGGMMTVVSPPPPVFSGNSTVVVLLGATANDKLTNFNTVLTAMSLTDNHGNAVTLYNNPNASNLSSNTEFMHLANHPEPLVATSIPQGLYTSASVTVTWCSFTDVTFDPSIPNLVEATYAQSLCSQGTGKTTVTLPSPVAVTGPVTALSLDLQVPQSFTLSGTGAAATYTIAPVFTLTPLALAAHPTNSKNGKIVGFTAHVTAVNTVGNTFTVQTGDSVSFDVHSLNDTAYQGISGFSALAAGTVIDLDFTIQQDGSFGASRVEASDPSAVSVTVGPFFIPFSGPQPGEFGTLPTEYVGCAFTGGTAPCHNFFRYDDSTVFTVSSEYANLNNLPFVPAFTSTSLLAGQNISVFSHAITDTQSTETVRTITLRPQTLNGTVQAVSSQGAFTVYTVSLASYDLIPVLQSSPQTLIRLNDPSTVTVYVDSSTQLLNSKSISAGSLLRFTGLVFDDAGTLRMDCGQVDDGVAP